MDRPNANPRTGGPDLHAPLLTTTMTERPDNSLPFVLQVLAPFADILQAAAMRASFPAAARDLRAADCISQARFPASPTSPKAVRHCPTPTRCGANRSQGEGRCSDDMGNNGFRAICRTRP